MDDRELGQASLIPPKKRLSLLFYFSWPFKAMPILETGPFNQESGELALFITKVWTHEPSVFLQ